jgi:hypothetical protein
MATLTINHYINQANSFITDIRDNRNGYYMFVSRPQPWANSSGGNNDTISASTNNSIAQVEQTLYDDLLYGKLLKDEDVINVIPRYNWTINTVYDVYDQNDADLYSKIFYVVTDKYEVYKCIDNNGGANSYVKPTLTSTSGTFKTGDGYVWKYMYSIDSYSNSKFTTTNYIPVSTNTAVQGNTTPGSIDVIKITNGGNSYFVYETGYIGGMINNNTIQLPNTASNTDDYYVKSSIYLKSGFGAGQIREISSFNGTTKQISVQQPFNTYTRLDLANVSGTVTTGYYVEQPYDVINYLYAQGYFNIDSTVTQSDTGASGKVLAVNTSVIQITKYIANTNFQTGFPIFDTTYSGTLKTGTVSVGNVGACNIAFVTSNGSGYTANATVTITANGTGSGATANAQANSTGKISAINITTVGNSYFIAPTLTISAPTAQTFNSNTAVTAGTGSGSNNVIALATAGSFVANDLITYTVSTGNTAIGGLATGTTYYVDFANTTVVALKASATGSRIALTKGPTQTGHTLQGQTATAVMYCDNQIIRGSGTQLNDSANGYANGEYIRVGSNTASNIRRVANNVNTTILIADLPFSTSFTSTGSINTISLSGATASGYNNNDIITIKSPIVGSTNVTVSFTTNSTGGSLTFTIANAGSGFLLGNVPVSNIAITNSTGGTATGNSTVTYLVANASSANSHYKMTVAAQPTSISPAGASGYVSNTNLTSVQIAITNSYNAGIYFSVGEKVNMTDASLVNQGANAIIAYSNSSTVILSSVSGSWQANSGGTQFYVSGESSLQKSQIVSVQSNPNITLSDPSGTFKLGYPVYFKTSVSAASGNATLVALATLPNDQTEYEIGPTVKFTGDGSNAVAIAVVNTAVNSKYDIVGIDIINPGTGYTQANVEIYANTDYGTGATVRAIISPVYGHGYDSITELGGRYVAIDAKFDTISNEIYKFPGYGSYRKVGILQNPQFKDVKVTLTDFDRVNLSLTNKVTTNSNTSITNWIADETVYQTTSNTTLVINYSSPSGTFNIGDSVYDNVAPTVNGTVTFANSTTVVLTLSNTLPASVTATFNSNTGVIGAASNTSNNTIAIGSNATYLIANNLITYKVSAGNTVIGGLANNGQYYIQFANSTHIALKPSISSNTRITLTPSAVSETGHTFTAGYLIGTRLMSNTANANIDAAYPIVPLTNVSATGVVVYGNSSVLQLKSVKGTFKENSAFNGIVGIYSNTSAFITSANTIRFEVTSDSKTEIISEVTSGAVGEVTYLFSNNEVLLSNVVGQFVTGDVMYDSVVNAYATVSSIYTSNGAVESSSSFGDRFNQTARITLTANTGAFSNNEYVQQDISLASGRIISTTDEKDLTVSSMSGIFAPGQIVTDTTTNANGICIFANTTYLKLSTVSQGLSFGSTNIINNGLGSTATVTGVYPVLVLSDVSDVNNFQAGSNAIIGEITKASATCNNYLLITNPDLVRDSGKMIYSESFTPVTRSATSVEEVKLVIKF